MLILPTARDWSRRRHQPPAQGSLPGSIRPELPVEPGRRHQPPAQGSLRRDRASEVALLVLVAGINPLRRVRYPNFGIRPKRLPLVAGINPLRRVRYSIPYCAYSRDARCRRHQPPAQGSLPIRLPAPSRMHGSCRRHQPPAQGSLPGWRAQLPLGAGSRRHQPPAQGSLRRGRASGVCERHVSQASTPCAGFATVVEHPGAGRFGSCRRHQPPAQGSLHGDGDGLNRRVIMSQASTPCAGFATVGGGRDDSDHDRRSQASTPCAGFATS